MDNGILQVYLSNPDGFVTRIQYNGIDNLLEALNENNNRGYITRLTNFSFCTNHSIIITDLDSTQ
jgi:hypothetical protein